MTPAQVSKAITDISAAFDSALGPSSGLNASLVNMVVSKLYEARVLAELLGKFASKGYTFSTQNGSFGLKAAPGPINPSYAYVEVRFSGKHVANIWTDVEFVGLSSYRLGAHPMPTATGEYHELDILVCDPGANPRPLSSQVYVGVECKHWAHIPKKLLREALGVRRELSFVNLSRRGPFSNPYLPLAPLKPLRYADPPSHMVFAYSTKYSKGKGPLADWQIPSQQFDIELWNLVL